jgi:hypothetical protein
MVIGMRPVAAGLSLTQWIREMTADHSITFSTAYCDNTAEDVRPSVLGGEKARLLGFTCPVGGPDTVAVEVLARHNDEGWFTMCVSEAQFARPLPDFEHQCETWLGTLQFLS